MNKRWPAKAGHRPPLGAPGRSPAARQQGGGPKEKSKQKGKSKAKNQPEKLALRAKTAGKQFLASANTTKAGEKQNKKVKNRPF